MNIFYAGILLLTDLKHAKYYILIKYNVINALLLFLYPTQFKKQI